MDMHIGVVQEPANAFTLREMLKRIANDGVVELSRESRRYFLTWQKSTYSTVQVAIPLRWLDDPRETDELHSAAAFFAEASGSPMGPHSRIGLS
jgi:hypothetical protein